MRESIVKRGGYNLIFGFLGQFVTIAFGVLLPRLVLVEYGSEVNGLLNSVTQIFAYFSLLEAGIGGVTLQSLYKTVGKQNKDETNAILSATNKYYKRTGFLYIIGIIVLAILYPIVTDTTISWWIIVAVISCNGVGPVVNYFVRAKYAIFLQAEGKIYVLTNIETITHILISVAKIVLLTNGTNVVVVQFSAMVFNLIQTVIILLYIKRRYKWIDLTVKPNNDALKQSRNAMIHQVGALVFNNIDVLLLTIFVGLLQVSVYSIYALLFGMVKTAISTINNSLKFAFGQEFNNNIVTFKKVNKVYENYFMAMVFALFTVAEFFIIPFLKLYMSGITDVDYFMPNLPILFALSAILAEVRAPCAQIISFAKHYKETQWRCVIETTINLCVSIGLVIPFGIYGVLFGTIVALLYRTTDMIIYVNKRILKQSFWPTIYKILIYFMVFAFIQFLNPYIALDLTSYGKIILWCIPYMVCVMVIYAGIAMLLDWTGTKFFLKKIKTLLRKNKD